MILIKGNRIQCYQIYTSRLTVVYDRIAAAPPFSGLRCFAEGRGFSQWTGDDSKALMEVYINVIEGYVLDDIPSSVRPPRTHPRAKSKMQPSSQRARQPMLT